jgi:hypothetical protein
MGSTLVCRMQLRDAVLGSGGRRKKWKAAWQAQWNNCHH